MQIKITKFRPFEKGALKGFFDLEVMPEGVFFNKCKWFSNDKGSWISFPSEEFEGKDKTRKFFQLAGFINKDRSEAIKNEVINKLKAEHGNTSAQAKASPVQSDASDIWDV